MITYVLTILYLNTELVEGQLENVVSAAGWTMAASDDMDPPNTYSVRGTNTFPKPDPQNFTPYDQLTEETVKNWIYSSDGYISVKAFLATKIGELQESNNKVLPLPWA